MDEVRPMSDLLYLPGGNGHPSASARRIHALEAHIAVLREQADHLKAMLAVLVVQLGGAATIPMADLAVVYDMKAETTPDELALVWTAVRRADTDTVARQMLLPL
jgi:hypothetical protein